MPHSILYDLSRLVTRVLNPTPNGIDRVDLLLARHLLGHRQFRTTALGLGFNGPRILSAKAAHGATERVAAAWREDFRAIGGSPAYEAIVATLCRTAPLEGVLNARIVATRRGGALRVAHALLRHVPPQGRSPARAAPHGALYINATHFPLEWKRHVAWLDQRRDVRPVFWIHDLLAIDRPDWFWGREPILHAQRLELLARRGAAALVASVAVEQSLRAWLERRGRESLPIFRLPPTVPAIFGTPSRIDERLEKIPFFVVCGTIEPRKNHLVLLRVWRELIKQMGQGAPRLVVIGKRGWNNAEIVAALEDQSLRGHVIEVAGLPTPDYKRLLDHSLALLAPSLAEGFGLPVAEALAAGVPVVASDIPPFREQGGENVTLLDPQSDTEWRKVILDHCGSRRPATTGRPPAASSTLDDLDQFLQNLAS
jgi:glycosyltransferase involved in cell wall biosynthesis